MTTITGFLVEDGGGRQDTVGKCVAISFKFHDYCQLIRLFDISLCLLINRLVLFAVFNFFATIGECFDPQHPLDYKLTSFADLIYNLTLD